MFLPPCRSCAAVRSRFYQDLEARKAKAALKAKHRHQFRQALSFVVAKSGVEMCDPPWI